MSDRTPWLVALSNIGLSRAEVLNLSEEDFQDRCAFALECGFAPEEDNEIQQAICESLGEEVVPKENHTPKPEPPCQFSWKPNRFPNRTDSGIDREEQNQEYLQALMLEKAREEHERELKGREEAMARAAAESARKAAEEEKRMNQITRQSILDAAAKLPPPPAKGIQLAINCPSKKRLMRVFPANATANDVYIFVASQDEFFSPEGKPLKFVLGQTFGGNLDLEKTLAENGITGRTLLNAILDED